MKTFAFSIALTFVAFVVTARPADFAYTDHPVIQQDGDDDLLKTAEQRVFDAFVLAQVSRKPDELNELDDRLRSLYEEKGNELAAYWLAYNRYYLTIFYMTAEDESSAKKTIKSGINLLKKLDQKNSETYALLASMQSLSIPLYSMIKVIGLSSSVKKNGKKALEMDPNNLRAHLVLGSSDYYTPEKYGGRKKVEHYLLKAIELPAQQVDNPYLPSWGKNTAYEILIRYYMEEDRMEEAKKMYKQAISIFPNDYQIQQLAGDLM
jgi:pentatricopeptide repeat protein